MQWKRGLIMWCVKFVENKTKKKKSKRAQLWVTHTGQETEPSQTHHSAVLFGLSPLAGKWWTSDTVFGLWLWEGKGERDEEKGEAKTGVNDGAMKKWKKQYRTGERCNKTPHTESEEENATVPNRAQHTQPHVLVFGRERLTYTHTLASWFCFQFLHRKVRACPPLLLEMERALSLSLFCTWSAVSECERKRERKRWRERARFCR